MTLEVFERHPRIPFLYRVGGSWQPVAVVATDKHFTDAELAAEWHRCAHLEQSAMDNPGGYKPGAQQRASIQRMAIERFATLPHWDETEGATPLT